MSLFLLVKLARIYFIVFSSENQVPACKAPAHGLSTGLLDHSFLCVFVLNLDIIEKIPKVNIKCLLWLHLEDITGLHTVTSRPQFMIITYDSIVWLRVQQQNRV